MYADPPVELQFVDPRTGARRTSSARWLVVRVGDGVCIHATLELEAAGVPFHWGLFLGSDGHRRGLRRDGSLDEDVCRSAILAPDATGAALQEWAIAAFGSVCREALERFLARRS